jgi:signal transduction histidine kinase
MKSLLFSPSLSRRVFFALIVAFLLAGSVLAVKGLYLFNQEIWSDTGGPAKATRALAVSLQDVSERNEAIQMVRGVEGQFNESLRDSRLFTTTEPRVFFQLGTSSGELLYETSPTGRLLPGDDQKVTRAGIDGHEFWVFSSSGERWLLRLAVPVFGDAPVLGALMRDLVPELLVAFPFVLIPLWLAIRRGLQPLSRLSEVLAARQDDDLSPLAIDMKYAELDQITIAIDNLLARLRKKIDREREFIQDAAHELRTPMAVISAQGHVLANARDSESRTQAESTLRESIRRASHLSEQLLSLASLEQSRLLEKVPLDIVALLQDVLAQMAPVAIERGIDLALESPDRVVLPMNRVAFHSIVRNLVDNALRYGPPGGHVVVTLTKDKQGDGQEDRQKIVLRVADDGPGIPAGERDQVFERFYRGKGNDATGTGLGLAIVGKAVHAMGGVIRVENGIDNRGVAFAATFSKP